MLKLEADFLPPKDRVLLLKFCRFVLNKFVTNYKQRNSVITIKIVDPKILESDERKTLQEYAAMMYYDGVVNEKRSFRLYIKKSEYRSVRKSSLMRIKNIVLCLAHELVHVKQYLNNEMFDYNDDMSVRFKGEIHKVMSDEENEAYYESPWELEAYGREQGLYKMFKKLITKKEDKKD